VARDRQRAKQRRRRQSTGGGPSARPAGPPEATGEDRTRDLDAAAESRIEPGAEPRPGEDLDAARDAGIEDVVDQTGPEGSTPTPDPLKHASPYVDEAKLAEAGASFDEPGDHTAERAPDDLGYSSSHADSSGREGHAGAVAPAPRRGRATTFLRNSAQELRRVQWPDRRQTGQGTAVTLGFVVLAGGFLGLMDAIWRPLVEAII
jgi:preprotein translocase SecE subunit